MRWGQQDLSWNQIRGLDSPTRPHCKNTGQPAGALALTDRRLCPSTPTLTTTSSQIGGEGAMESHRQAANKAPVTGRLSTELTQDQCP